MANPAKIALWVRIQSSKSHWAELAPGDLIQFQHGTDAHTAACLGEAPLACKDFHARAHRAGRIVFDLVTCAVLATALGDKVATGAWFRFVTGWADGLGGTLYSFTAHPAAGATASPIPAGAQ